MQRFFTLVALLLIALPVGLSTTGCTTNVSAYCNNAGYGPKITDIFAVRLPAAQSATGISLSYGQSTQIGTITATSCKGNTLSAGAATYGSSNLQLVDISPTGVVCAGTWNRTSPGGIPDFTVCTAPSTSGTATVTGSVGGVTSNPLTIYVHPQVSAINIATPTACVPSGTPLLAPGAAPGSGTAGTFVQQTTAFGQDGVPIEAGVIGNISYTAQTPSIITINNTNVPTGTGSGTGTVNPAPNGSAVANQPGGTVITATIAGTSGDAVGTSSAAGYFYTCPPQTISLSLPSSASNNAAATGIVNITAGNPQTINSVLTSVSSAGTVNITPLAGNGPDYTSTQPQQVSVTSTGTVTGGALPGSATISGICQPGVATTSTTSAASSSSTATGLNCNPTPLNRLGTFGTGLPIVANPIRVVSQGVNNYLVWAASPDSQQFTPFDLSLGTGGSPVLLPYPPNSMVLDPTGNSLYFGSYRELMIYSAATNTLGTQDVTVPGVVLAVSPSNNQVVIADQLRQVIYLYTPSIITPASTTGGATSTTASSVISTGGLATHAVYSPDGKNAYVIGPNTLYVHNVVSGWSTYPLTNANATVSCPLDNTGSDPFCSPDIAITVPSVAVFMTGSAVTARSFCPDTTTTPVTYNPFAATITGDSADHLAATIDGNHILGANTTQVFDVMHGPTTDTSQLIAPVGACPGLGSAPGALGIQTTLRQLALTGITPTQIDQVLTSPDSSRAFITYTAATSSGLLPFYTPSATPGTAGTLSNIQLAAGALDPLAGVFSNDSARFFVSTSGDNLIHIINTGTLTDIQQLNPQLLSAATGQIIPARFIVTKARPTI